VAKGSTSPCRSRRSAWTNSEKRALLRRLLDAGWKGIEASDMLLMPDPDSARMDPFHRRPVLTSRAMQSSLPTVRDTTRSANDRQARGGVLKSSGLWVDTAHFWSEPEFFVFDSVTWNVDMSGCFCEDQVRGGSRGPRARNTKAATWVTRSGQGRLLPGASCRHASGHP